MLRLFSNKDVSNLMSWCLLYPVYKAHWALGRLLLLAAQSYIVTARSGEGMTDEVIRAIQKADHAD